jgi:hypothetical protein
MPQEVTMRLYTVSRSNANVPFLTDAQYLDKIPDAYSHVKLASVSASSAKAKSRKLELHNPDLPLLFEFTGTL